MHLGWKKKILSGLCWCRYETGKKLKTREYFWQTAAQHSPSFNSDRSSLRGGQTGYNSCSLWGGPRIPPAPALLPCQASKGVQSHACFSSSHAGGPLVSASVTSSSFFEGFLFGHPSPLGLVSWIIAMNNASFLLPGLFWSDVWDWFLSGGGQVCSRLGFWFLFYNASLAESQSPHLPSLVLLLLFKTCIIFLISSLGTTF